MWARNANMRSLATTMLQQLVHKCQHLQQRLKASQPLSSTLSKLQFEAEDAANAHDKNAAGLTTSANLMSLSRESWHIVLDILGETFDSIQGKFCQSR